MSYQQFMAMSALGLVGLIGGLIGLVFGRLKEQKNTKNLEAEIAKMRANHITGYEARMAVASRWRRDMVNKDYPGNQVWTSRNVALRLDEADEMERLAEKCKAEFSMRPISIYPVTDDRS